MKKLVFVIFTMCFRIMMAQLSLPPSIITSNVAEANQYKVVYEFNIPNNGNYSAGNSTLTYAVNNSATTGVNFTKVAYFMDLGTKWVWVSMNKFTSTLSQLGIPFGNSGIIFQQQVGGMNIVSSSGSGVSNATNINGNIEIWPNCYSTSLGLSGVAGNSANYDFNDFNDLNSNCYGSFQVHNYGSSQTVFAYNSFNSGSTDDLGIGNNTGTHPDWTFMANAANYATKKLYILVNACSEITINTHPSTATQNFCLNATGTSLSVSAVANSGTITGYQWYRNTTASYTGATLISGATSSSYSIPTSTAGTNYYFCVVTNSNGCGQYSNFSGAVNVNSNPTVSAHPNNTNQNLCQNAASVSLSVTASAGSGSISSYQWYKSSTNSNSTGSIISGATATTYSPPTSAYDSGYYYCLITNSNSCSTKSNPSGLIKINPSLSKGTLSANQVVCYNSTASDVSISGNSGTIQWQKSTDNSTWTNISGATNATLTSAQIGTLTATTFIRAQLTSGGCTDFSNTVSLDVNNALAFDGTNDYVNLGDVIENINDITEEAWVYWRGSSQAHSEIFTKDLVSSFAISSTNKLHANFGNGTAWGAGVTSSQSIPLNTWTHVAVTRSSGVIKLYINGVEDVNTNTITLTGQNTANRLIGGKMVSSTLYNFFNGIIDELRVWNYARSAKEINDNEYRVLNGNESGLILYHQFNRGTPSGTNTGLTTLFDKSSSALNGTLVGFALTGANSNYVSGNQSISVNNPDLNCGGQFLNVLSLSKVPNTYQWYRNTTNSNTNGTLISGATSDQFQALGSISGNTYYYATTNSCSSSSSNTIIISNPQVTGTLDVYEDNTTQLASVESPSSSSPWVSLNPSLFTINTSGLVTGIYPGTGSLVYTSSAGCKDTVNITVHATEWNGNNSKDFTTGSNWKLNTKPNVVKKIRFNNSATNNLILTSRMSVDSIDFGNSNKQIELGNNDLVVNHIQNFNSSKYIKTTGSGKVKKQLTNNTSFTFPVGNSSYNPITITNKTGTADTFSISILDTTYLNGSTSGNINNPFVKRTWNISKNVASANSGSGVDLTFNWNANEVVGNLINPTLNHHNGSGWEIPLMGVSNVSGNSLTYTGYKGTFSPFAIGGSSSVALPVELKSFNAICSSDHVNIEWKTASEKNNDRFELYKSADAKEWTKIYSVKGQGTKATETKYLFNDYQRETGYYRLKDIDFNGKEHESQMIFSDCNNEVNESQIYPSPVNDYLIVSTPLEINKKLKIISINGVLLKEEILISNKTRMSTVDLMPGIYILEISTKNNIEKLKFIKL